jgi:glucokinase
MACGVVDVQGRLLMQRSIPTPQGADAEDLFAGLAALIHEVRASSPTALEACGVGCGGPMERGGTSVSPLNIEGWRGFPLASRIAELVELPLVIDNDAKALALGEWWTGAAAGISSFLAMVVSTGIGGGIVLDDTLVHGRSGNAGHIGHVVVEPDGRFCRCGVRGCLEAEASGTAIEAISGEPAKAASQELRCRTGRLVGRAVASVVTLLDLRLCVIAGSVALGFGAPFFEAAQAELERQTGLSYTQGARIIAAGNGADGPLIGAAALGFGLGRGRSGGQ